MSEHIDTEVGLSQIERTVFGIENKFVRIADRHKLVTWAEESQFALQAVEKNPELAKCDPVTVQDAIINVAAVGLTLNPVHQYAYLVPEFNKNANRKECQLRISYKGLIKIATDSGAVKWVKADVIHKNDTFVYKGPNVMPDIAMHPFEDRGDPVGVYCVAKTHDDEYLIDTAPWADVMKAKAAAKTQYVWNAWESEMAKKFAIKRASKQWPKTDRTERLSTAVNVVNEAEGNYEIDYTVQPRLTSVAAMALDGIIVETDRLDGPEMAIRAAWNQYHTEAIPLDEAKGLVEDARRGLDGDHLIALWQRFDSKERSALKKNGMAW